MLLEFLRFQLEAELPHSLERCRCGAVRRDGVQVSVHTHSVAELLEAEHALLEELSPTREVRPCLEQPLFKILLRKLSRAIFEMLKVPCGQIIMQKVLPFPLLDVLDLLPNQIPLK